MRRPLRIVSCIVLGAVGTTICTAGAASAVASTPAAAHSSALTGPAPHALGAARPTQRVAPAVVALDAPPASADLRQFAVSPGDQGEVGSCVTWAIDYSMLGWYSRSTGRTGQPFAPMYTYSQINGGVDEGSSPTAALGIALTQGSDTRADYTQGDYDWVHQPTAGERANAAHFKIAGPKTLFAGANQSGSMATIEHALATRHPVAIEMAVRHGFDILGSNPDAVDSDYTSAVRGYHEVLAVAYDSAGLIIENSWGTGWANGGFGRISWGVVLHDVWEADTIDGFAAPAPLTPPVTTTPAVRQNAGAKAAPSVSYTISWTGTSGTSGAITRYDAWSQVDGQAPVPVRLSSATANAFVLVARSGHHYRFGVRAYAGSAVGAIRYSATFFASR